LSGEQATGFTSGVFRASTQLQERRRNERLIDVRLLLYVITIAEEGSITGAALKKLFVAQGSLARDIRNFRKADRVSTFCSTMEWGGVDAG
jgi:hypothetical protein